MVYFSEFLCDWFDGGVGFLCENRENSKETKLNLPYYLNNLLGTLPAILCLVSTEERVLQFKVFSTQGNNNVFCV